MHRPTRLQRTSSGGRSPLPSPPARVRDGRSRHGPRLAIPGGGSHRDGRLALVWGRCSLLLRFDTRSFSPVLVLRQRFAYSALLRLH